MIGLVVFTSNVSALYIGTAPGTHNLGALERGDTYEFKFYISTDAERNFTLTPEPVRPNLGFYEPRDQDRWYGYSTDEASMENISDWITFPHDAYDINPDTSFVAHHSNGASSNVQGTVNYFLEVPKDAEPGYHAWTFNLDNDLLDKSSGTSVSTIALSQYTLVFRVPGEVERDLVVNEVKGLRSGDNRAVLRYQIENKGTVTMRIRNINGEITNRNGRIIGKSNHYDWGYIAPGETKTIESTWMTSDDLKAGNYRIRGKAKYITGQAFLDDTFSIESFIEIQQSNSTGGGVLSGEKGSGLPIWMVVMFLVLIGALMYSFEIDPLLIIMTLGVLAISLFIWMSGLPMFLIGVVLIVTVALLYYGWM